MEWRLGLDEDLCELVWLGRMCDGGGGLQGQVERDAVGNHTKWV